MTDYRLEIINKQAQISKLAMHLAAVSVIALDIETVEWWDKYRERIALIQIAYRNGEQAINVAIIDALPREINIEALRPLLESNETIKVIHNAAFDAGKLFKHYKFKVAPVFDTMAAARGAGERKYSLAAQSAVHLNLHLDKSAQRSDWSRRPLDFKHLDYAARDAFATLLLYESQQARKLTGDYRLRYSSSNVVQGVLDLLAPDTQNIAAVRTEPEPQVILKLIKETSAAGQFLTPEKQAILDIITKLPDRYSPAQLVASVGLNRVGLAGWIVDQTLGKDADFDEETAQIVISDLFERRQIRLNEFQKLEMTAGDASERKD